MKFSQDEINKFADENNVCSFHEKPLTFKSGKKSHYYINWRSITEDVYLADRLADFIISFVSDNGLEFETFYGVPDGATKVGLICQYKRVLSSGNFSKGSHALAMGRAKPKLHGDPKNSHFLGKPKGRVIVLEDVVTTGSSLVKELERLKESEVNVVAVVCLSDYLETRKDGLTVKKLVEKMGYKFYSLTDGPNLVELAKKKNLEKVRRK